MTEKKQDDIVSGEEEAKVPPTPTISAGSEQAGSKESGFDAEAFEKKFFERFDDILDSKVDARVKSIKDRRFNMLSKAEEILAAVEAAGGDPEKIRGKLETDELLNRIDQLEERLSGVGGSTATGDAQVLGQKEFEARTAKILEEAGIPLDDPEVLELKEMPVANEGEWYRKLTTLGIKRAKQGGVTSSAVVGDKGKVSAPVEGDELLAQIMELQKHPVANEKLIKEKMAQAREAGLLP
jgi:hypothetical protein